MSGAGRATGSLLALTGIAVVLSGVAGSEALAAQSPFGIATPDSGGAAFGGPLAPLFQWIAVRQAEFYRALTGALSELKENGWAAWLLLAISFAYGVFHAAGPGHGKAVISAYVLSSGESLRQGVLISFAAALVQAFTAIAVVVLGSIVLRVTARSMTVATEWIEIASYALIALVGAWLLWTKATGRGHHHHHHRHDHGHHDEPHGHHHGGEHDHGHDGASHVHNDHGRDHGPTPAAPKARGLAGAWSAILAVGIRPCSGAIIVLVFALAQGLFLAGIAATLTMALGTGLTVAALATLAVSARGLAARLAGKDSAAGAGLLKAIEILGALAVLLLGLLLLGGALGGGVPG